MRYFKTNIVFGLLLIFFINVAFAQQQIPKKNIERFSVSTFTKTSIAGDSLDIFIFMQVPYFTLQYVKNDTNFIARFEAVIALQTKKGNQISRKVWQDSVIVRDYNSTNSITKSEILMLSSRIKAGKYKVVARLLDLDTKNSGENIVKLDYSDYDDDIFIHEPVLLEKMDGNWGFGEGFIPALSSGTFNIDEGLNFYLSGIVKKGKYELKTQFLDKDDSVLFENIIIDTSQTGIFGHIVKLPSEEIKKLGIKVKSELVQGKYSTEKIKNIVIHKAGISHLVSNIDEALQQMRYVLTTKERAEVKKISPKKREELFKKLWKGRDPTPDTIENELMNEYYRRVAYANAHFDSFIDGWETDMGMIYIIFGPPDDISRFMLQQRPEPYETWNYYRIQESFTFAGDNFGHYRLTTPFIGYQR